MLLFQAPTNALWCPATMSPPSVGLNCCLRDLLNPSLSSSVATRMRGDGGGGGGGGGGKSQQQQGPRVHLEGLMPAIGQGSIEIGTG